MIELISVLILGYLKKQIAVVFNLRTYVVELIAFRSLLESIKLLRWKSGIPCNDIHYLGSLFCAGIELEARLAQPEVTMTDTHVGVHSLLGTWLLVDDIHPRETFLKQLGSIAFPYLTLIGWFSQVQRMFMYLLFNRILFKVTDIGYLDSETGNMFPLLSYHLIIVLFFNLTHFVVVEDCVDLKV